MQLGIMRLDKEEVTVPATLMSASISPLTWVVTTTVSLELYINFVFYTNDPLWDGEGCGGMEEPCCNHTGLPWFSKSIPTPTTAHIKVQVCLDEVAGNENLRIEQLELYMK